MKKLNGAVIPLSARRQDIFSPPSLHAAEDGTGGEKEVEFTIRIPTPSERDTLGARLFEHGLTAVSPETIRATTIDEIFKLDWGKGSPEENEIFAEELADKLDGYWQRKEAEDHAANLWVEQEAQRMLDEGAGAPPRDPIPPPTKIIKIREHSQVALLVNDIMTRSERLRGLAASQMDFARLNNQLMVRLHLLTMTPKHPKNWPADLALVREESGFLSLECVDDLREFIGDTAWNELVGRIDRHFSLSEDERKNFDSPPAKPSDQTGLPGASGDSENSDGKSTGSSTGHAPIEGSETTTGKSSGSVSGSEAAT